MEHVEEGASPALKRLSFVLQWAAIIAAASVFPFGGIAMLGVFYFLDPRASAPRARVGIMLSLLPLVLAGMKLQGQRQMMQDASEFASRWEGTESPAFTFTTIDGQRIDSSQLRGKRVLLNFWATWCPACRSEIPEINRLVLEEGGDGIAVFGFTAEGESTIREFLRENPVEYPLASMPPGRLPAPFDKMTVIPTSFVIDRNGIIDFVHGGYAGVERLRSMIAGSADGQNAGNAEGG